MNTTARRIGKTASEKQHASPGTRLGWPDVLRVLQSDETRSCVLQWLREACCFSAERWHALDRRFVAIALGRAEDRLELRGGAARGERDAIRAIRRRLELELWP